MASSKLINCWRQRQILPSWGFLVRSMRFSSTTQITHQILPTKAPSLCITGETLTPTPMFKRASPSSAYFMEVFKLGMGRNILDMEISCSKFTMVKEEEEKAFHELLDAFVINYKFKPALQIFDFILKKKHDNLQQQVLIPTSGFCTSNHLVQLNFFMRYLYDSKRVLLALHQFQRMNHQNSSSPPNHTTFEILICGLMSERIVGELVVIFDQLFEYLDKTSSKLDPPFTPDFYAAALPFLVKRNEPYRVSLLLRMMKDSDIDPCDVDDSCERICCMEDVYYNTVRGFCYLWRFEDAARFLDEHRFDNGFPWSNVGFVILCGAYCNAGMFDNANDLLDKMVKENIGFSCEFWKHLIGEFCKLDAIDKAFDLLKRMISFWDQRVICHELCINQYSPIDVPVSKDRHTLTDLIWHYSVNDGNQFFGLALYVTMITGVWKESYKCEEVHRVAYSNAVRHDDRKGFLENMIKIGACHVDHYAAHIKLLCEKGAIYEAFRDLNRMISLWDIECANRTCSDQASPDGSLVPDLEPYLSLSEMILSSVNGCSSKGDEKFLALAIYAMLTSGVWKEGHNIDAGTIVWNGGNDVSELPEIKPVWTEGHKIDASTIPWNGRKLVPELQYVMPA